MFIDIKQTDWCLQNAELRCLLPKSLLDHGFFAARQLHGEGSEKNSSIQLHNYSWSGQRKVPSYVNRLVFPQEFLTALRTIALHEDELNQVSALLEEVIICFKFEYFSLNVSNF